MEDIELDFRDDAVKEIAKKVTEEAGEVSISAVSKV